VTYTAQQRVDLCRDRDEVLAELQSLMLDGVTHARALQNTKSREYLDHGVGRRLSILRRSIEEIFALFPPWREHPLARETLADVQIYLHAFVINLYGIFDNWAWAFVLRHDLLTQIGYRTDVGLFKQKTQQFLPNALREYLVQNRIADWHEKYLKEFRDALVHRIPLYVPPATWSTEDRQLYEKLEDDKVACIRTQQWDRLDKVCLEQDRIGKACPVFMHEFSGELSARPLYLHPQLLCDGKAVVEFGKLYLATWHERA
jgi:hypothetical protein